MFVELGPLTRCRAAVFLWWALVAAAVEELLVVAYDDDVEDGDTAAGGLDAEVTQESRADVDGESGVDQLGGEQPPEVVRGERSRQLGAEVVTEYSLARSWLCNLLGLWGWPSGDC
jgi:hypothetical protein